MQDAFILASTLLALWGAVAPLAAWQCGVEGVVSSLCAMTLSLGAGLLGLATGRLFRDSEEPAFGVLAAMGVRTGIPLAICLAMAATGADLTDSGFIFFLLLFYLAMLAAETALLARQATRRDLH